MPIKFYQNYQTCCYLSNLRNKHFGDDVAVAATRSGHDQSYETWETMSRRHGGLVLFLRYTLLWVSWFEGFLLIFFGVALPLKYITLRFWGPLWGVEFSFWQVFRGVGDVSEELIPLQKLLVLEKDSIFEQWPSPVFWCWQLQFFDVGSWNGCLVIPNHFLCKELEPSDWNNH